MASPLRFTAVLALAALCVVFTAACEDPSPASPAPQPAQQGQPAPAAQSEPAAGEAGLANTLKWSTVREKGNVSFDVYRGEHPDGPFQRLNAESVAGAGTSEEAHDYRYVDTTIQPGVEYFYYVESLDQEGKRARVTPVIRAPAKQAPAEGG